MPVIAPGWTTACELVRVTDGDTLRVRVSREFDVRLLDCWCPELRSRDPAERAAAQAARHYLTKLLADAALLLHVPTDQGGDFASALTFGRLLGRLYLPDGRDVSELLVAAGHATRTKQG